jgi:DNA-binding CsgD family transcriptional regulator
MLLDRADERSSLDFLLDAARRRRSGVLILEGDAGMGKTALLDYIDDAAGDMAKVRVVGVEAEQPSSFASLHRVLLPFLGDVDRLPLPQRAALECAFGVSSQSPADVFLVGLATLTLMAEAATHHGLLCIIDDAQWLDPESLKVMGFVGRRLGAEGIALVFGFRTPSDALPALAGLGSLEIGGLPEDAALDLLTRVAPHPLDSHAARRIVRETSGCPLAIAELGGEIASLEIGSPRLLDPIPVGPRLEAHFRRQAEDLSAAAQLFLLIAAVEGSGDIAMVRRAARALGCDASSEAEAVHSRLLTTQPHLGFRHPLIRSAIYAGASATDRVKVHRELAAMINSELQPERWALHAMAIATGPDEGLAADLEAAAQQARDRGGVVTEAAILTYAAEFSEEVPRRSERLLKAASAAMTAGSHRQASALLSDALSGLDDPLSLARAEQLNGRLRTAQAQYALAPALHLAAAQQFLPIDADLARESLLEAFDAFAVSQQFTHETTGYDLAHAATGMARTRGSPKLTDWLLEGMTSLFLAGYSVAVPSLHEATRILQADPTLDEITRWYRCGYLVADELLDDHGYKAWVNRVEETARDMGAMYALSFALLAAAKHETRAGRFANAESYFVEAAELASARGLPSEIYDLLHVELHAWRGKDAETQSAADAVIDFGLALGNAPLVFQAQRALTILYVSEGRYTEALEMTLHATSRRALGWTSQSLHLVVEAGVRCGDRDAAARALAELEVRARASGTHWGLGLLARSRAIMAEGDAAEKVFGQAITELEQSLVVTDLAHTHLVYGEWLRKQNRRLDAQVQLRKAVEMFEAMGARGFADRAARELAATGERPRQRTPNKADHLTPQERQIAILAAQGVKNREIATKLFISSHTVDYHLRKVYRKLDVRSRYQLQSLLSAP